MKRANIINVDRRDERQTRHSKGEVIVLKIDGNTALVMRPDSKSRLNSFWISVDRIEEF